MAPPDNHELQVRADAVLELIKYPAVYGISTDAWKAAVELIDRFCETDLSPLHTATILPVLQALDFGAHCPPTSASKTELQNAAHDALSNATGVRQLGQLLRYCTAMSCEANIAHFASQHPSFIRAYESASHDYAILLVDGLDRFRNNTDKLYHCISSYQDSEEKIAILADGKSIQPKLFLQEHLQAFNTRKYIVWEIALTVNQYDHCQFLYIASIKNPELVAVVPRAYWRIMNHYPRGDEQVIVRSLQTQMQLTTFNDFPPEWSLMVMPMSMLGEMESRIEAFAKDASKGLRNPFSELELTRCTNVELAPFSMLMTARLSKEMELKQRIHGAFQRKGAQTGLTIRHPDLQPLTGDLIITDQDGNENILELKQEMCSVVPKANDVQELRHATSNRSYKPFLHYQAVFDHLLTTKTDHLAYIFRKEDLSMTWWHSLPEQGNLRQDFPSTQSLARHEVLLDTDEHIVEGICRHVQVGGPFTKLRKSTLTSSDIMRLAGPLPSSMLAETIPSTGPAVLVGDDEDIQQDPKQPPGRHYQAWQTPRFGAARLAGMASEDLLTNIFILLAQQCRSKRLGIMVDLAHRNPLGRIGILRYRWRDADCKRFDAGNGMPHTLATQKSHIPLISLVVIPAPWLTSFTPLEPTTVQFDEFARARPVLTICDHMHMQGKQTAHDRWIVPSEFMPDKHLGTGRNNDNTRSRLFLKNKMEIEEFRTKEADLHEAIYGFFTGSRHTTVGLGKVEVVRKPYLKSVGDAKISMDLNYPEMMKRALIED